MTETRAPGRPKGSLNKVTMDVKLAAQKYTDKALRTLAKIMEEGESEAARVAAANSILDRGHGKPKQALIGGDESDAPIRVAVVVREIVRSSASPQNR